MNQIIQIVTRLPPAIDGIGDYSLFLARQLREDSDIDTHFIVGDPEWAGPTEIEGFQVAQVSERSSSTLYKLFSEVAVQARRFCCNLAGMVTKREDALSGL